MLTLSHLPRPLYIAARFGWDVFALLSRLLNATFYGGSTNQTLSARSYIESLYSEKWMKRRRFINGMFFWQKDHCQEQWLYDVEQAEKVIERNLLASVHSSNFVPEVSGWMVSEDGQAAFHF